LNSEAGWQLSVHRSDQSAKSFLLLYNSLGSISVQCHSGRGNVPGHITEPTNAERRTAMSDTMTPAGVVQKPRRTLTRAVIRFAGDSGDGMQVTGEQFTTEAAWAGNDIS